MSSKKLFACALAVFAVMSAVSAEAKIWDKFFNKKTQEQLKQKANELWDKHGDDIVDRLVGKESEPTPPPQQQYVQPQQQYAQPQQPTTIIIQQQPQQYQQYDQLVKTSSTNNPAGELESSLRSFAGNIVAHNKPVFEIQLQKNELPKNTSNIFNKVCAKDQTITAGHAGRDRKYLPLCMVTADPAYTFVGGIRVGAPVRTVENFFMSRISDLSDSPGHVRFKTSNSGFIELLYANNTITQIGYYDLKGVSCRRTGNFVYGKMREMGFQAMFQ